MSEKNNAGRGGCCAWGSAATILILLAVLIFVVSVLINPVRVGGYSREAEVKANLHAIQLAVERFAVDSEGSSPQYLIGGSRAVVMSDQLTESASDPLLREGYLTEYPRNPFVRSEEAKEDLLAKQGFLPTFPIGGDPLRPMYSMYQNDLGYRFGADGSLMGQVLCDPRWEYWNGEAFTGQLMQRHTWADVEYRMWDTWDGTKGTHGDGFLEGQFFYKSLGPMVYRKNEDGSIEPYPWEEGDPFLPTELDQYIMGAYGSSKTKGQDILGSINPTAPYNNATPSLLSQSKFLRSEYAEDGTEGSPYSFDPNARPGKERIAYGNPNGIRDGVILVLTAGGGLQPRPDWWRSYR